MGTKYGITKDKTATHVTFTARGFIRPYAYTVKVTAKSGKVVGVWAGCRNWKDFPEAFFHYDSRNMVSQPYGSNRKRPYGEGCSNAARWSDEDLLGYVRNPGTFGTSCYEIAAHRAEARAILNALQTEVERYQWKQTERRAARRKAKR